MIQFINHFKNEKKFLLFSSLLAMTVLQAQEEPLLRKNQFKINVYSHQVFVYEHGFNAKHCILVSIICSYQYSSYNWFDLEFLPTNK
jgi:hypothetical protein